MIILGIDPGTTRIGFGIIEKSGSELRSVHYGLLPVSSSKDMAFKVVFEEIRKLTDKYKPDAAAVEKLFFFKNQKTIISVSEMRGVILAALAISGIPIYEFTPLQVKQAVSSYGRAGKDQVESMVRLILGLREKVRPDDAADGLAIAICCANTIIGDNKL
ncbi:MAG: crossover junction endodeoxyribonuclease RuvC [Candidatus Taylorbacteria bacterium]|nr:crossover junction endodeoxyribonuclease RuvC [Candidatus Taylorbacteria bacterium]